MNWTGMIHSGKRNSQNVPLKWRLSGWFGNGCLGGDRAGDCGAGGLL